MRNFANQVRYVARHEVQILLRYPKMLLAVVVVALLPSVYAAIYLTSVWDPGSHSQALTVALVNLDEGVQYRDHVFNVGSQVVFNLNRSARFGYVQYDDSEQARQDVRMGKRAFALIIPKDFSSNAIPGAQPGGGKLVVYASEGNNFQTAALAKQFANELGHEVNESLNERRWSMVLTDAAGSQRSVDALRAGVASLRSGAEELHTGTTKAANAGRALSSGSVKLQTGVGQATDGFKQLGNGLRTLDSKRAPNSELNRLNAGAAALVSGHTDLIKGMDELQAGSRKLLEGATGFKAEADDSLLLPGRVKDGVGQLAGGINQLDDALHIAADGQKKLADGATRLSAGVNTLTSGMRTMNGAVRQAVSKLPEDSQLDELASGSTQLSHGAGELADGLQKLKAGSQSLSAGLDLLANSLPASIDTPEGSPEGLANSVKPIMEIDAVVGNSGSGFAPNVIPAALWLGAGVAAFLIHLRVLPRHAKRFSSPAKLLGKITVPVIVVALQAALLGAMVTWGLKVPVHDAAAFATCLGVAGMAFLMIVLFLSRAMGDAGKVFAMVFLAVQLSASGGVLPVELSGGLYEAISPWMPMTWTVRAVRAAMFGAYGGEWIQPLTLVAAAGAVALMLATLVKRWRYLPPSQMQPTVGF
ncbi:YhgE/Pip domain-containing protein [Rhodoferax sp.]|uniref:YhgE/Pip domain-containing protein n=1 Tax=Rhodoferax sp. TaxID=50421 RepID=UPI0025FB95EB|nr:YhgE/Pip domain-containing protein [Rhodoferax sp.]